MEAIGKKRWIIPDCELPREGEGELKGHESVIIVNDNEEDVRIKVTLFFTDDPAYDGIEWTVKAKSVRCFRMNNITDMCGYTVPLETQYAMKLETIGQEKSKSLIFVVLEEFCKKFSHVYISPKIYLLAHIKA